MSTLPDSTASVKRIILPSGHASLVFIKKGLVPVAVPKLSDLSLIPARDFGEIAGDPSDAIDIVRSAISTELLKPTTRAMTKVAGGEFRREGDLVILSPLKCLDDKIGQGRL